MSSEIKIKSHLHGSANYDIGRSYVAMSSCDSSGAEKNRIRLGPNGAFVTTEKINLTLTKRLQKQDAKGCSA